MNESVAYYSVMALGALVRRLPLRIALALGRAAGTLAWMCDGPHRRQVHRNLKTAFGGERSHEDIVRLGRRVFQAYAQNFIELLSLPRLSPDRFRDWVDVEGGDHVRAALEKGRGAIFLAMHYGSWELAGRVAAGFGRPYRVLVNPQRRFSRLDDLLNRYRRGIGSQVILRGFGVRELLQGLRDNEVVGLVVDQGGRTGTPLPFFGREARFSTGALRIAFKTGAPVLFAVIRRRREGGHRIVIHPPFEWHASGEEGPDLLDALRKVVAIMEREIRAAPEEYMWFYKIWKFSPRRTLVILDDGRTGHLRQSQAVARCLAETARRRGLRPRIKEVDVRFRNEGTRRLASVAGFGILPRIFLRTPRILRLLLTEESYRAVTAVRPDVVLSCGTTTAPVNYLLSRDAGAGSIFLLRPGLMDPDHFDLGVMPRHDRPERLRTRTPILITEGAPNLITPDYLERQTDRFLKRFSHLQRSGRLRIGVLIGGDTRTAPMSERSIRIAVHQLREAAEDLGAEVLATTSRRTPVRIEGILQSQWRRSPVCRLLIIAAKKNVPEAVGGILGLCDILLVTGDSISMISEAAASGKKTIVFSVTGTSSPQDKHEGFVHRLAQAGYVVLAAPDMVRSAIQDLVKGKRHVRPLRDHRVLEKGLEGFPL